MKKTVCDRCNKDITGLYYYMEIQKKQGIGCIECAAVFDLCEECWKAIFGSFENK